MTCAAEACRVGELLSRAAIKLLSMIFTLASGKEELDTAGAPANATVAKKMATTRSSTVLRKNLRIFMAASFLNVSS
jgi:hypothetical protein